MLGIEGVSLSFGEQRILNGVSFSVPEGQTVGIIGPNGSGKTTLFNCLSGFHQVDGGTISLGGDDVTSLSPHERAHRGIGRVFQNFGIFREMTVFENLLIGLESSRGLLPHFLPFSGRSRAVRREVEQILEEIGLSSSAYRRASSLSGGQMRLLEIARTLASGASVFLLDEPTAGVSPIMKEEVGVAISRMRSAGKTTLIIEHDIHFVQRFCDRIIVLDQGRVVLDGAPADVRKSDLLAEIYLGKEAAGQ